MTARSAGVVCGVLVLLGLAADLRAQAAPASATGAVTGVVRDERGTPVLGAMVSAVGATNRFAVTDRHGRFTLETLAPGSYVLRAHLGGYVASLAQVVDIQANATVPATLGLRRASTSVPILAAGVGAAAQPASLDLQPRETEPSAEEPEPSAEPAAEADDRRHEVAWRLRHARRGILKESTLAGSVAISPEEDDERFFGLALVGRAVGQPARLATAFFGETPFSGQVNILTTTSFETPEQLFSSGALSRGTAYARVGAPVGSVGDWTVRGALTQADISAWIIAGSYATRAPARHRYDVGMSYSTQRYDGGNPLAVRDVADGSRNVGEMFAFDTFTITPALVVTYGGRYARYDYLDHRSLFSPRAEITVLPGEGMRVSAMVSRRAQAPGAEEFLPPGDSGIWLPPQRTFSALDPGGRLDAQHATQVALTVARDIAASTISLRAFHQRVDDQLVTVFGAELPSQPAAHLGHYLVGSAGRVVATGYSAELSSAISPRIHGSVAYTLSTARLTPAGLSQNLLLLAPSALRTGAERIHDVTTAVETNVPETATRVLVLHRVSNGFARPASSGSGSDRPGLDSRFDVQVRQSLPFMNFTNTKWEMLVAVRNFFREASPDQAIYDELLVVRPPKRIVGGVTMHF